jgi:outer membrane scaffolding protein for murein synthesis (MipA/OmpV family)
MLAALGLLAGFTPAGLATDNAGMAGAVSGAFDAVHSGIDLLLPEGLKDGDTQIRLGAGFGTIPDYTGSDDYRLKVLPIIDIRWRERWRLSFNKLSYSVIKKAGWEIGPFVKYKAGRSEDRNPILMGMGDISATAQVGGFARYKTERMLANLEVRHGLSGRRGTTIIATFGHGIYKLGRFGLAAAVRAKWMNDQAMQTEFGVTEAQAAASQAGLRVHRPLAGIADLGFNLLGRVKITEKYRLMALVGYGRLFGGAADSPLVAEGAGSRNQFRAGVGFTIDF